MAAVVTLKVPEDLRSELYRAIGEAQARDGRRVYMKELAVVMVKFAIAYLRNEIPRECLEVLETEQVNARG